MPPSDAPRYLREDEQTAHLAEVYGAEVSKQTISTITDKVIEGMTRHPISGPVSSRWPRPRTWRVRAPTAGLPVLCARWRNHRADVAARVRVVGMVR
ncbi:hypothetical protein FH610_010820 [Microbispora catharanthi]|uniref:Mutator family transposase n=1 Tax=Microbispora catharanthi TaxID=1712871 RepID=A0A5N6BXX8_9ACTN|nr:hypothetical protein FH610_010820 [Microbispora catharanthi]